MYDSVNRDLILDKIIFFAEKIYCNAISNLFSFIFIIELYKFKSNIVSIELPIKEKIGLLFINLSYET